MCHRAIKIMAELAGIEDMYCKHQENMSVQSEIKICICIYLWCNEYPLQLHFYIVKLGFVEQNHGNT